MGYGVKVFCKLEMRLVPIRVVVYGIRYRANIHFSILALTGEIFFTINAIL